MCNVHDVICDPDSQEVVYLFHLDYQLLDVEQPPPDMKSH